MSILTHTKYILVDDESMIMCFYFLFFGGEGRINFLFLCIKEFRSLSIVVPKHLSQTESQSRQSQDIYICDVCNSNNFDYSISAVSTPVSGWK